MREIKLCLPKVPLRGRKLMEGRTWQARYGKSRREQGDWRLLVRTKIKGQEPEEPLSGVVIETTIYRRKGFDLDDDNRLFSIKPLVDVLVDVGILWGDSTKHLTQEVPKQIKIDRAEDEMTIVVIKERK